MAGAHDPCCPVHVDADILGCVEARLAGVYADPDPDRTVVEGGKRLRSRVYGPGR